MTFQRVLTYFVCELDTYKNIAGCSHLDYSDFNIVENSKWLEKLPIRKDFDKSVYRHFQVFTYDFVYNIIAVLYELKCNLDNAIPQT